MSKKFRFRGPFHKSHGKRAETLLKAEQQHLYHIIDPSEGGLGWKNPSE